MIGTGSDGMLYYVNDRAFWAVSFLGLIATFCFFQAGLNYVMDKYILTPKLKIRIWTLVFNYKYFPFYNL